MKVEKIKELLRASSEYRFIKENQSLGKNTILLAIGGSHAYGMDTENSDVDIRGIALNKKEEILLSKDYEQVVDVNTDTTIYSFNKMIGLLTENNPNTIEILGCKPEHYLYVSDIGKELLDSRKMFLSKLCIPKFMGYANGQIRRMENKSSRLVSKEEQEKNILKSIDNAKYEFKSRYFEHKEDEIDLYVDKSSSESLDSEVFMDITLRHYPLRDWVNMWNDMKSIVRSYDKLGKRNEKAITHDKLGKHMAHLIRLYIMGVDILEKEEIITYREDEHDLLMSIRNGEYLDENRQPKSEFYDILNEYEKRFEYAKENTSLPDKPDIKKITEFRLYVNERIVRGEI